MLRCTSSGSRPATWMRPPNGTLMAPSWATICSGIVTLRDPLETWSVGEAPNKPPPAASHIDTTTESPTPIFGCGGLPYFLKRALKALFRLGAQRRHDVVVDIDQVEARRVVLDYLLLDLAEVGPAVGSDEHPAARQASNPDNADRFHRPPTLATARLTSRPASLPIAPATITRIWSSVYRRPPRPRG